jgi:hypothetical protein
MWGEEDTLARWIQGICAIFLAIFSIIGAYIVIAHIGLFLLLGGIPVIYGSIRLCWRCTYYALTGKGNVNRDTY